MTRSLSTSVRSTFVSMAAAGALLFAPMTAQAQSTYTSFDDFVATVGVIGTDSFDDLTGFYAPGPIDRTAGAAAYSVQASGAPFDVLLSLENPSQTGDLWLSTEEATAPLAFSDFGSDVFAIGGQFFATDLGGAVTGTALRIAAFDVMGNSVETTIAPTTADGFFGVRFDFALASFTITADNDAFAGTAYFPTVNSLVLGGVRTVPEPSAMWLLLVGAGGVVLLKRRRGGARYDAP